jgi:hypothetical protein
MIPSDIKFEGNAAPPQWTDGADQVIEKGTNIRIKIKGIRSEVDKMYAVGTMKEVCSPRFWYLYCFRIFTLCRIILALCRSSMAIVASCLASKSECHSSKHEGDSSAREGSPKSIELAAWVDEHKLASALAHQLATATGPSLRKSEFSDQCAHSAFHWHRGFPISMHTTRRIY